MRVRPTCLRKLIWVCLVCSGIATRVSAQYRFDSWTNDNGLPAGSVNSILQTRDGYLWLATFDGLVRFDGLHFQVFNTGNTKGLRSGRFMFLYEDRAGSLWISPTRLPSVVTAMKRKNAIG
jgi:ligand-binding sensor domain-containing protein